MAGTDPRAAAETWFLEQGLPWFVDDLRAEVSRRLHRGRVSAVVLVGLVLGAGVGAVAVGTTRLSYLGFAIGASVLIVVCGVYALWALHAALIAGWALRRAFHSLGLLMPLATRALPMLVLFATFLFINSDVWQVASRLHGGILWTAILFFIAAALLFLVPQLAREVDVYDDAVGADDVREAVAGTALEAAAETALASGEAGLADEAQVTGLQRVNLVTALVIAQGVQVALLSLAVFAFFLVFGVVAIKEQTVEGWIGHPPTYPPGPDIVSIQLIRVSTFLAGFSGFYFTVTAITDEHYRREFFTAILGELRRAVGVRVVYRRLGARAAARPAPPEPAG